MPDADHEPIPRYPRRAIITGGMPYGNKGLHFGHIGGVFVPADFFARFLRDRIGPENVLFVSGTDCYGSPIVEGYRKAADLGFEGTLLDYVQQNHEAQERALYSYGISLDIFAGSALEPAAPYHAELSEEILRRLYERGCLERRETLQFYDTKAHLFLNGRQVLGRCPVVGCKSEKAYADECDLGHQFDPEELINPVSAVTGTTPELRPSASWYFDLPAFQGTLEDLMAKWREDPQVRDVVTQTVSESLVDPAIYIQMKYREDFEAVAGKLPPHRLVEPEGNQQSFSLVFSGWRERDLARDLLEEAGVRFRTGKCLLPFRLTGNIAWGVAAPSLEGEEGQTVWVWPESLWAPISFTKTALALDEELAEVAGDEARYRSHDWRDWWCADDAQVFQFIGQDNIYFYCAAQPAMWAALDWGLFQDTPVANYHILFMNKKASSSGAIKPPMAEELLDYYTPEQLRLHWLSLALDQKAVSFSPKPFDTSVSHKDKKTGEEVLVKDDPRVADPALKEGAFLSNIFNRLARSCFYGAQRHCEGRLPEVAPAREVVAACDEATRAFDAAAHDLDIHGAINIAEDLCREANRAWSAETKAAGDDEARYLQALANAFRVLRTVALLLHSAVPDGTELICEHFDFPGELFFSWEHAYDGPAELAECLGETPGAHALAELPSRFDFFPWHESQRRK